MCSHVSEKIKIEIAKKSNARKNQTRGKLNAWKIELAEELSTQRNRTRGNQIGKISNMQKNWI